MTTVPYAEFLSPRTSVFPQADELLVNSLSIFPPLSLSDHCPGRCSDSQKRAIAPQPLQNDMEPQDWQLVEGVAFSSTTVLGNDDDQWEDIDYSTVVPCRTKSFAKIAEHAGTDHGVPIPHDQFLQWPKAQYARRPRRQRLLQHQHIHHDDNSESTGVDPHDLYELSKSRSRLTRRKSPFVYERRERAYLTKTSQELRCSVPMEIQNFGWLAASSSQQMSDIQCKTHYVQAKLNWLNERAEQLQEDNNRYRPLSKKTAIFVRALMQELVDRDEIAVSGDDDDDDDDSKRARGDESSTYRRPKAFWEQKSKRDALRKQRFLQRQSPFSQYNSVVHYLYQQERCGPTDQWRTFYDALHDMYKKELADLGTDESLLIKQTDADNNREQVLRGILKFAAFYHFICKRERWSAEVRYKTEQIQGCIVDHWRDPCMI